MVPGYWMHETSGVLKPVINAYLKHEPMTEEQIGLMRAYLRQWIMAPVWNGVDDLRADVEQLTSREAIKAWLDRAMEYGIDPI